MTDVGSRRAPPVAIAPTETATLGAGSSSILTSVTTANGINGQPSIGFVQPTVNGISSNYSGTTGPTTSIVSPTTSAPVISGTLNSTNDQQLKQQTAFIVLPISFRMAASAAGSSTIPQHSPVQQIAPSSSTNSVLVQAGSLLTQSPSAKLPGQQRTNQQPISSDQAVKTAVNWIVHDTKNRQQQNQKFQQIGHRNNGKVIGPSVPLPNSANHLKGESDGTIRKFSISPAVQNEERYFTFDMPSTVSLSEPNTPHPYYSPAPAGMKPSKLIQPLRSTTTDMSRRLPSHPTGEHLNGLESSPAGKSEMAGSVSSTSDVWSPASQPSFPGPEMQRHDIVNDSAVFVAGGMYNETDLPLATNISSYSEMVTKPGSESVTYRMENGGIVHQQPVMMSSFLISPSASSVSETTSSGTPPVSASNLNVPTKNNSGATTGGKHSSSGNGTFCAFEERQCKQRCINGYRYCIRHILCDPNSPYRLCSYVKKQGAKEIRCSNAVALSQGSEYCSTHLIMMGMKEAKRKKVSVSSTPVASSQEPGKKSHEQTAGDKSNAGTVPVGATTKKKKAPAKKPTTSNLAGHNDVASGAPPSTVFHQTDHGSESAHIQYNQSGQDAYYGQHEKSSQHHVSQPFLLSSGNGHTDINGICSEMPSTSSPSTDITQVGGVDYMHQQQQRPQVNSEFQQPYFVGHQQQPISLDYQNLHFHQQASYQPQPVYVPGNQQHDYGISPENQQSPFICYQQDHQGIQVLYEQQQQVQEGHLYDSQYSTVILQEQQHQTYDPMHSSSDNVGTVIANVVGGSHNYNGGQVDYLTASSASVHGINGGNEIWKMSPMVHNNGPIPVPQKAMSGTTLMCHNGSTSGNSELVRTHPELTAHLMTSSSSNSGSPQSRRYSSGSGNGSAVVAGFPPGVSHYQHHPQMTVRPIFHQHQQFMEPLDDSGQGFATATRFQGSYLLNGEDPFLGASSSSGFPSNSNTINTVVGAQPMGVVMMSPVSSELSMDSPHSVAIVTASTMANAGVGLTTLSTGHQQPKVAYYLPAAASDGRFSSEYQESSPLIHDTSESRTEHRSDGTPVHPCDMSTSQSVGKITDVSENADTTAAPPVAQQSAPSAPNKKVIRLKQKKRHLRMVGPYRQIPAISHMCKILEDLDFDRKDLFPLGLEPSSSDTDSDDECDTVFFRHSPVFVPDSDRHAASESLMRIDADYSGDVLTEQDGPNLLPGIVSRARRQLYLLKKALRLDENRMRRRVNTESRVIASASRLYPNSVGAALSDRRRDQISRTGQRRGKSWLIPSSEKKAAFGNANRKAPAKGKKIEPIMPELDPDAELELSRSLAPRRCIFESPATVIFVQQPGSLEHRKEVLAQQRCVNRCLPYCNFCSTHVVHSEDQQLYRKCANVDCHRAVFNAGSEALPSCSLHKNRQTLHVLDKMKVDEINLHQPQITISNNEQQLNIQPPKQVNRKKKMEEGVGDGSISSDTDATAATKRKRKKPNTKAASQDSGNMDIDSGSKFGVDVVPKTFQTKRAARISSSSLNRDDESAMAAQEALTLASVAQDFGFEDHELTEMLIRLPDEAFDGILETDLARTGPGVITITDSGGGNDLNVINQGAMPPSALGVEAIDMAVQAATSSCGHNWADVEQFLLSEGYGGGVGAVGASAIASMAGFFSPPPAYTNLTNVISTSASQGQMPMVPRGQTGLSLSQRSGNMDVWTAAGSSLSHSSSECYVNQSQTTSEGLTVLLPNVETYASTSGPTPVSSSVLHLVNNANEQNSDRMPDMATTSTSWNTS